MVARRSTPRAIARRRSPPRSPPPVRAVSSFFSSFARASPRRRAPSVGASVHTSVPHREKAPRGPPPSKSNRLFRPIGRFGRTGPRRRDATRRTNERDEIERNRTNERTNEGAREETVRAPTRSRGFPPVLLPSLVRSFARSRRPEVRTKITNLSCLNGLWVLVRRKHPEKVIRALSLGFSGSYLVFCIQQTTEFGSGRASGGRDAAVAVGANETCERAR